MTEIFADGIRSIAVTNGVLRIELMQLRHNREQKGLEPQSAGTLMMPVPLLKDFTFQLVKTLEKLKEHENAEKSEKTPKSKTAH